MNYYNKEYNFIQSTPATGLLEFPDEFMPEFYKEGKRAAGFVDITDDGQRVTSCVWNEEKYLAWCEENPETPETPAQSDYIPTPEESAVVMMRAAFASQAATMDDETILQCSGLADDWAPGNHTVGEVFNTRDGVHADGPEWDQTWEVYQAYNNDVYQDVAPGNSAWYTFNRPLHGKSKETARPFVKVQGSHDIYRSGEYMVYTDGKTYRCKSDTNYSPEDYPQHWEVVE